MADDAKVTAVRLLVNDPAPDDPSVNVPGARTPVFTNGEVTAYLDMEGGNVKRAAAQALDTIADDQALTLKAATDRGLTLDGPKVADSLRKRAAALRAQADREQADEDDAADDGYFDVVHLG